MYRSSLICIHFSFIALVEGLLCKPTYRANIIHHFIFVVFIYIFNHSSYRKNQFTVLSLKSGTQDFTDPRLLKIQWTLTGLSLWFAFTSVFSNLLCLSCHGKTVASELSRKLLQVYKKKSAQSFYYLISTAPLFTITLSAAEASLCRKEAGEMKNRKRAGDDGKRKEETFFLFPSSTARFSIFNYIAVLTYFLNLIVF